MAAVSDIVQPVEQRKLEGRWELHGDNNPL
jgi:hypothetical protein